MVRLKWSPRVHRRENRVVPIPLWCDWNGTDDSSDSKDSKFQYLYGAIEMRIQDDSESPRWGRVPIPLWCDWNDGVLRRSQPYTSFQYLYGAIEIRPYVDVWYIFLGSNTSMVRLKYRPGQGRETRKKVPIPLWCDWNTEANAQSRLENLVPIPLWCDWNLTATTLTNRFSKVPIPLWCDWNAY